MLDLQRHTQCPIWENATKLTAPPTNPTKKDSPCNGGSPEWPGLEYACLNIIQTYCKIFNQEEIYDLIVRYGEQLLLFIFFND